MSQRNEIGMLIKIEVERIFPNPRNKNIHSEKEIAQLAASIKAVGIIEPLIIRPQGGNLFEIISGEARWQAAKVLDLVEVPCVIKEVSDPVIIDKMRLAENKVRTDFSFIAECQEYANLHRQGVSSIVLAREFNESESYLGNKISVGYLPDELLKAIRHQASGIWSLAMVIALLPLRQLKPGRSLFSEDGLADYSAYDYTEVQKAIELVNQDKLTFSDLRAYVSEHRLQLLQKKETERIQAEVEAGLVAARQELQQQTKSQLAEIRQQVSAEKQAELAGLEVKLHEEKRANLRLQTEKAAIVAQMKTMPDQRTALAEKEEVIAQRDQELAAKDAAIKKKEAEIKKLFGQIAGLRQQLDTAQEGARKEAEAEAQQKAKEIAEELFSQYKADQDAAVEKIKKAWEDRYIRESEKLRIKTEKTIQDGISHYHNLCVDLEATVRVLVYERLEQMTDSQIQEVIGYSQWAERKFQEVGQAFSGKLEEQDAKGLAPALVDNIKRED